MDKLTEDLKSTTLQPRGQLLSSPLGELTLLIVSAAERDAALEELKVYGRDPNYADPIFTKQVFCPLVLEIGLGRRLTHVSGDGNPCEIRFRQFL